MCGDGVCDEVVCLGEGCPCAETSESCAVDCFVEGDGWGEGFSMWSWIIILAVVGVLIFIGIKMAKMIFWVLIVACGLLNFGRILMIRGQLSVEPGRYWSAYLCLLVFFVGWCLLFVDCGGGKDVAEGFLFASIETTMH